MKKILLGMTLLASISTYAEQEPITEIHISTCNGPRILCFCDSERSVIESLSESEYCEAGKEFEVTGSETIKKFGRGQYIGGKMYCTYKINYQCNE